MKSLGIPTFLLILMSIMAGAFYFIYFKIRNSYVWNPTQVQNLRISFLIGTVFFLAIQMLGPKFYRNVPIGHPLSAPTVWFSFSLLGFLACFFVPLLLGSILARFSQLFHDRSSIDLNRRVLLGSFFFATTAALVGTKQALAGPKIKRTEIPLDELPQELVSLSIVQISDLHIGLTIRRDYIEHVVRMANAESPDIIVLTGDFADGSVDQLRELAEILRNLKSKHGIYFCTGNHEYYSGADDWVELYKSFGFQVLTNDSRVLFPQSSRPLVICGVPDKSGADFSSNHAQDLSRALENTPAHAIRVLLSHRPDFYETAARHKVHLMLSGHTHSGQFFPWSLFVSLVFKYHSGLNRHEGTWIYVNTGTGYWGPPNRFLNSSEISSLRLVRAQSVT